MKSVALLWLDVVLGEVLSWMAVTSSGGDLEPEVHLELAELHGLLSKHYRRAGSRWLSRLFAARSAAHWALGGGDDLPPAVALAMPVPSDSTLHDPLLESSDTSLTRGPADALSQPTSGDLVLG